MGFVDLAVAKPYLNIPIGTTIYDDELTRMVDAACAVVEEIAGRVVSVRSVTEQHDAHGTMLALNVAPVVSLTSITDVDGINTWDVANYRVDGPSGVVSPRRGVPPLCGRVEIVCQAGLVSASANYVQAALVTLRHLWESQRVPVGGRGVGTVVVDQPTMMVSGWSVPRAAVDLIGPRLPGIA